MAKFLQTAMESLLGEIADPAVLDHAQKAVADGTHEWRIDPDVENVFGLLRVGTNQADIVVYGTHPDGADFELSKQFEEMI